MGNKQGRPAVNVDPELLKPSGLYPSASYDERALRRLILERKVAPCFRGSEEPGSTHGGGGGEECPICMLYYPALNTSSCCKKRICTECYLQMAPPTSNKTHNCPFCKRGGYAVEYRGPLSALEQQSMQAEEQRVIELQIEQQVREQRQYRDRLASEGLDPERSRSPSPPPTEPGRTASPRSSLGRSPDASLQVRPAPRRAPPRAPPQPRRASHTPSPRRRRRGCSRCRSPTTPTACGGGSARRTTSSRARRRGRCRRRPPPGRWSSSRRCGRRRCRRRRRTTARAGRLNSRSSC